MCFEIAAYLTNPSETSFRTFLTEQAFRHHLSRLDDAIKLLCLEMPKLKAARPEASTIQMILDFASQENREEEARSRIKRYLPDLSRKLPTSIRRESL